MQQAARLINARRPRAASQPHGGPRVLAVASGKGGVGKSNVVLNLGLALRDLGQRVLLVDADWGLGKLDLLLGLRPGEGAGLWVGGQISPGDALLHVEDGIDLLPAASGLSELARLPYEAVRLALYRLMELAEGYDVVLVDAGAGIGTQVQALIAGVPELLIVTTVEPPAVADAYALAKTAFALQPEVVVRLVVNQAAAEQAEQTARNLDQVTRRFLDRPLPYLGCVPIDPAVPRAVRAQRPLGRAYPAAPANRAIQQIAARLWSLEEPPGVAGSGARRWLDRLLERRRGYGG